MHFLPLTLLFCLLNVFSSELALEYPTSSQSKRVNAIPVKPSATNILYQSKDGGQTWEDISYSLPAHELPEGFFAGASDLYLRANNVMYRSKSNLNTPVWEKENELDPQSNTISFNRSGVIAYNYDGQVYQKMSATGKWLPVYTNFKKRTMRTIFESADGSVFLGSDNGLYKSADKGRSWKQVQNEGWVMDIVESEGVLIATGQGGIMRSIDQGEHWEWVISEGGVGIVVERIEGGFAAIAYNARMQSRRIHISMDSGKTWKAIDGGLQPSLSVSSIKQIGKYLVCGHPDGIFRSSDLGKTWQMVHAGVENKIQIPNMLNPNTDNRKVFNLFVSGNVVYAVAREGGC